MNFEKKMSSFLNTNSSETSDSVIQYSQYSCSYCRKAHRKCDKKLPSCSKCQSRNTPCEYKQVLKKNKMTAPQPTIQIIASSSLSDCIELENHLNSMNSMKSSILESDLFSSLRLNIIGAYFEIICLGCPFLERETLESFLFSRETLQNNRLILSFVFSIQALVGNYQSLKLF